MVHSAFLQVLFENIFKKIGTLIGNEVSLLEGLTEALEELESAARKFQHVVRAAEMKKFKSPETNDWYLRLGYAANMADGVLDEALDFVDSNKRVRDSHSYTDYLRAPVEIPRDNLGKKIRLVTQKFNNLDDERSELNFEQINIKRETVSALSEVVFGREEEKDKIITTLLCSANTHPFIYAIVGLGGIGKTTLAQLIYNDQKVIEQFDTRMWVWVSQTFDVKLLMEKIIETFSKQTCKFESLETTQSHLNELLKGKKFLLVLDDIWNENPHEWNILKSSLKLGAIGSSVLLTTRGSDVASISRVHEQHKIAVLSEDQCWHVFKESAFLEIGELEVIGKQIAKKCGGLPLAAKSLGGTLRLTQEVCEWEVVRDSPIWELPQSGGILPALKLSMDRLESHSRNCFTFCCLFSKGHKVSKEELIQLWMANDLIPFHPKLEPEDMGNKILNDLVLKSFFQVCDGYDVMQPVLNSVTMHDLMHDLCIFFRNDCFSLQQPDVSDNIPPQCRHLSIDSSYPSNIPQTLSKSHSSLHTCIITSHEIKRDKMELIFKNLDCLRALGLCVSNAQMKDLPISIGKIKELKYLDLCWCHYLTHLPDSIGTLTKLQTLKLRSCEKLTQLPDGITRLVSLRLLDLCGCYELTHLPDGVSRLVNLRHLHLSGCSSLTHLPHGIGKLINLRYLNLSDCRRLTHFPDGITGLVNLEHLDIRESKVTQLPNGMGQLVKLRELTWFSVGIESGQRITELQRLYHLRGSLEIRGLEHVRDAREAEAAILRNKNNLSSLSLIWKDLQGSNESEAEFELESINSNGEAEAVLEAEFELEALQGSNNSNDEVEAGLEAESVLEALQGSNNNIDEVEGVLEALQPSQSLNEELVISGYGGTVFASWMKLLENLVQIELKDCNKCERLPPLGQLPLLKLLTIKGMKSLKCIGTEFFGSNDSGSSSSERCAIFPSLVELVVDDMPILEEWQDNQQADSCPYLERLKLSGCPKLTSLPSLILSFLAGLEIRGCDKVIVRSLSCLTSLVLNGRGTKSITSFPEGALQNLDALESLTIVGYDELELSSTCFQHLTKLQTITLDGLPRLTSLPELQHFLSLKTLGILRCQKLKMLPQWLQNLTSLEELRIKGCHHDLHSRCEVEYWPFIKHIPALFNQRIWNKEYILQLRRIDDEALLQVS